MYRECLFHGPALHGIERIGGVSDAAFTGTALPAPPPAEWLRSPLRSAWVADPLVLDASFQMMILWTQSRHDTGSLPCFAGRYRQYRRTFPPEGVLVTARITRDNGTTARADIEFIDADGRLVAALWDAEHVIDASLNEAFRRGRLAAPAATCLTHIGG